MQAAWARQEGSVSVGFPYALAKGGQRAQMSQETLPKPCQQRHVRDLLASSSAHISAFIGGTLSLIFLSRHPFTINSTDVEYFSCARPHVLSRLHLPFLVCDVSSKLDRLSSQSSICACLCASFHNYVILLRVLWIQQLSSHAHKSASFNTSMNARALAPNHVHPFQ